MTPPPIPSPYGGVIHERITVGVIIMRRSFTFTESEIRRADTIAASRGETTQRFVEQAVAEAVRAALPETLALLHGIRPD